LKPADLTELKTFNAVGPAIEITCHIAFLFFSRGGLGAHDWNSIKTKFLGESGLLDSLKNLYPGGISGPQAKEAKKKID
jgi:hypothetical protein